MVASANSLSTCKVLFALSCCLVSCEASFLSGRFGASRPLFGSAYLAPFRGRVPEAYCAEAIKSKECELCAECNVDEGKCVDLFKTDTCWPGPNEEVCLRCYDEFGASIFPKRVLTNARTKMAYKSYRRRTGSARFVDPAMCDTLNSAMVCTDCETCMGDGSKYGNCKAYFQTDKCWPAPQSPECFECFDEFGSSILPDMK
ncbi:hypothetical protein BWQ96_10085 [Gracilariopsis chorda]|uniref:Uncharacterized protein n=1 Tax=Gracilariopsis chorda TaxID=448386 RepID=A0A2V3IDP1_9FLOR|nr:hypothetical protein BWQ96_10085 [Gracilariopsis chorda]|eukprot:PXF40209.1 hypothetical protein BWQ96_10085 [Gracilariopsis chorda]